MFLLDHVGAFIALFGCMLGWVQRPYLEPSRRWLTIFLGISGACGVGQWILQLSGKNTAWFGNVWDLSVVAVLIPSCMMVMRERFRVPLMSLQILSVAVWGVYNLAEGGMPQFDHTLASGLYGFLAFTGAVLFYQFMDDPLDYFRKPEFILASVAFVAGGLSSLTAFATIRYDQLAPTQLDYLRLHPTIYETFCRGLMTARNAVWCGAYALLAYSLLLKGRNRAANAQPQNPGSEGDAGGTVRGRDLRVLHT